ncbi:MAG: PAS domain S-box protein [Chromatiales bacterium]|nr:PAS domain S-box protein [Chromatiales bacterium]
MPPKSVSGGSIRNRFLVTTVGLAVVLLVLAVYAQHLFSESVQASQSATESQQQLRKVLDSIKAPLRGAESVVYRYAISLDPTLEWLLEDNMRWVQDRVSALLDSPLTAEQGSLRDEVLELKDNITQLEGEVRSLMKIIGETETRYPGMSLLTSKLVPLNQEFQSTLQRAVAEGRELRDESPEAADAFDLLLELRHYWLLQVSAFRVFIANRSGVFGEPTEAMRKARADRQFYAEHVGELLQQLKAISSQNALGFQQTEAIDILVQTRTEREKYVEAADRIYSSAGWRADLPILNDRVRPLLDQCWSTISQFEVLLERRADAAQAKAGDMLGTLSQVIWLFAAIVFLLLLLAYYVFEYAIRRPILKVAEAMEGEARNATTIPLAPTRLHEPDLLISAFTSMQEQVRSRQQRIESILDNAGEGIVTIDDDGTIESFNLAAARIYELPAADAVGEDFLSLLGEDFRPDRRTNTADFLAGLTGGLLEVTGSRKGGEEFPMDLSISEMWLDRRRLFIAVLRDITERKHAEEQLHEAIAATKAASVQLAEKNGELTSSLEELRRTQAQLVESEKMASLGGLVAGVAHEINTPVGIGVTAASHLQQRVEDLREAFDENRLKKSTLKEFVDSSYEGAGIILTNLQRAADLVQSFKQVAVDQATDSRRRFNLRGYFDEVLLSLRPTLKKTPHKVEVDCPANLEVDSYPGACSQIITNLIMNSLKHAFEDGESGHLRIGAELRNRSLVLTYSDDGRGIPSENLKKIFEPFFTTKRGQGGSGLGMHLVYNIVTQRLGGKIRCESTVGEGTRFVMEFPQDCPAEDSGVARAVAHSA